MSSVNGNAQKGIHFAEWVRSALSLAEVGASPKVSLFGSSIPEPTDLLADVVKTAFEKGVPETYVSVFLKNHPVLEDWVSKRYNVPIEHVLCTSGASTGVEFLLESLSVRDDHILVESPGFDVFHMAVEAKGLSWSSFSRNFPDFGISIPEVLKNIRPNTSMVIVTDPHNPSGLPVSSVQIQALATSLASKNIVLVIDEVYRDYEERFDHGLDTRQFSNVVRIGSFTKNFGLNTLRFGWVIAGDLLKDKISTQLPNMDFSVSKLAHSIAAEVTLRSTEFDENRRNITLAARPIIQSWVSRMIADGHFFEMLPLEGCMCLLKLRNIPNSLEFSEWLATAHNVIVVPGECFGVSGYIRIGYALESQNLTEGLKRLEAGLIEYSADNFSNKDLRASA